MPVQIDYAAPPKRPKMSRLRLWLLIIAGGLLLAVIADMIWGRFTP